MKPGRQSLDILATSTRPQPSWMGKPARNSSAPPAAAASGASRDFLATMPSRYQERFANSAVRQHAWIAEGRGNRPAHVGLFDMDATRGPALCVVTEDAPGVLAAICASLMLEGFDVLQAEAYTRTKLDGEREAVDLFWVRRAPGDTRGVLDSEDAAAVCDTLIPLLRGKVGLGLRRKATPEHVPAVAETTVRFLEHESEPHLTLEVVARDRPGLLHAIASALTAEQLQIVGSHVTTEADRIRDRFDLVQADGSSIPKARRQRIQLAILATVDSC